MGQSLQKLSTGDGKRVKEIDPRLIDEYYEKCFTEPTKKGKNWDVKSFYQAVCEIIQAINTKFGYSQLSIPSTETVNTAYKNHQRDRDKKESLTIEEFRSMFQDVVKETRVTGTGSTREVLMYIFGAPLLAFLIKQKTAPHAIPNEVLIPGVTSATACILAILNKI